MLEKRKAPDAIGGNPIRIKAKNKDSENRLIMKALKECGRPLTRRELSYHTGLEIASLCRCLFNLVRDNVLKINHYARCKTTGMTVMHYAINKPSKDD